MKINAVGKDLYSKTNLIQKGKVGVSLNQAEHKELNLNNATNPAYADINFTSSYEAQNRKIFKESILSMTPDARELYLESIGLAKSLGHGKVTYEHVLLTVLAKTVNYIKKLDEGFNPDEETLASPWYIAECAGLSTAYKDPEVRQKMKTIFEKKVFELHNKLIEDETIPKKKPFREPEYSDDLIVSINQMYAYLTSGVDDASFSDAVFASAVYNAKDDRISGQYKNLLFEIQKATMLDNADKKEKNHLSFYDSKADRLWKNMDLKNDVYVTYDGKNSASAEHLISSFVNLINKPGQKYNSVNPENTNITVFNEKATFSFINSMARKLKKEQPEKQQIFVFDFYKALAATALANKTNIAQVDEDTVNLLLNKDAENSNIHFILTSNKDVYFSNTAPNAAMAPVLSHYNPISIPVISANDAIEMLNTESGQKFIEAKTKKAFSTDATRRIVELTNKDEGYFPEKALSLMKRIAAYTDNTDMVGIADVEAYEKEMDIKRVAENAEGFNIIFDTNKKLGDIVGTPMTKAEAKSVADLISSGKKGFTRGYTTYLDNGSSYGGGRRHTAEAIAGETGIPMIAINARDFALKDIDALSENAALPELKIKKIVSAAKTQAETNKNKAAMIFIENFDNFGSDPLYGVSSIYEQKAFSQLLTEMDNIRKNEDVNLIVIGSMNRPELLDENIIKPYKFLDNITIYTPQDAKQRKEILDYYIEKNNVNIAGGDYAQQQKVVQNIAETTSGFSPVDLIYLLEKAQDVSSQRGKDAIDKSDFTEAFLQTVTGRVSQSKISEPTKKLLASHECGHALNLQVMYDLAKTQQKPWHLPEKVDFITLDPRGWYGGCVFAKQSQNEEYSFERIFSDLVWAFGGYSCEKEFFNMNGSWGISQDMQDATNSAKLAVEAMGMGANVGRFSLRGQSNSASSKMKEMVEDDARVLLKNAETVSDLITQTYKGFVDEFMEEYSPKVGTGECIIPSEEFKSKLDAWKARQPKEKQEEIRQMEAKILQVIDSAKGGKVYKDFQ